MGGEKNGIWIYFGSKLLHLCICTGIVALHVYFSRFVRVQLCVYVSLFNHQAAVYIPLSHHFIDNKLIILPLTADRAKGE